MTPAPNDLSALRDIHLPDAVAFWPPAPGWWFVAAALLTAAGLAWIGWRRRRRGVRRQALRELELLAHDFQQRSRLDDLAAGLSILMRRVALLRFGAGQAAVLHGEPWIDFLVREAAFGTSRRADLESIERAVYAGIDDSLPPSVGSEWITATRDWIERTT